LEKERLEKEKIENERLENERLEKEKLEKERLEKEKLEKEKTSECKNVEVLDQSDEDIFDIQEYFGKITGQVAVTILDSQKKGTYILRWSDLQQGYMVSYRSNDSDVCHIGPLQKKINLDFLLIEKLKMNSQANIFQIYIHFFRI